MLHKFNPQTHRQGLTLRYFSSRMPQKPVKGGERSASWGSIIPAAKLAETAEYCLHLPSLSVCLIINPEWTKPALDHLRLYHHLSHLDRNILNTYYWNVQMILMILMPEIAFYVTTLLSIKMRKKANDQYPFSLKNASKFIQLSKSRGYILQHAMWGVLNIIRDWIRIA